MLTLPAGISTPALAVMPLCAGPNTQLSSSIAGIVEGTNYQQRLLSFERSHIDREAVFHIGLEQSLVSLVDLLWIGMTSMSAVI